MPGLRILGVSGTAFCTLALMLLVAASSCAGDAEERIVAFGDVHGDLEATRQALRLAGAVDEQDRWIGGDLIVVQTGDQLDRGDEERAILDLFERLRIESRAAGGAFHALLGNHELMNARGDLRYVTDGGFADFADAVQYDPGDSLQAWDRGSATFKPAKLSDFAPHQRGRMAAFMPGGPYADLLAQRQVILQIGDNVFVHGGVLPDHVAYGVDEINAAAQAWLRGEADLPSVLSGSESPQWTRLYSSDPDAEGCKVLEETLTALEAERIIVGHTRQESGITSACAGRAWLIDVGMAAYYGGSVEVLEIVGDSVRVLKDGQNSRPPGQVGETSAEAISPEWCRALPRAAYAALDPVVIDSDWFEVWDVGENVFAIYEPKQWQEIISYLILGTNRALLFDTGMGIARISDVVRQLTDLPVTVLNSHTHLDHIGGNAEFDSVLAMDTDFTRSRSAGLANQQVREEVKPAALCGPLPEGVTEDNYVTRPWTITQVATDGHIIDLGGRFLEIVAVPGHTPDAIALLDPEAGYIWTGDSFYEGPIWLFAPETDLGSYAESVERMAALAPRLTRVFPAHNTPVADPARLVELRDAFFAVQEGTLEGTREGDMMRFEAGAFSLLLRGR